MVNPLLGQLLGSVFGRVMQQRGMGRGAAPGAGMGGGQGNLGGLGGLGGAALGGVLGGMMGRGGSRGGSRNKAVLMALLLPMAMRWVQSNGGLSAVVKRFQDKGYGRQANSWVEVGENEALEPNAIDDVVGREELSRLSQQLGVPEDEVRNDFAEILPEVVNQLTPAGRLDPDADVVLQDSIPIMEDELQHAQREGSQA